MNQEPGERNRETETTGSPLAMASRVSTHSMIHSESISFSPPPLLFLALAVHLGHGIAGRTVLETARYSEYLFAVEENAKEKRERGRERGKGVRQNADIQV